MVEKKLSAEAKLDLIKRNTAEILMEEELKKLLKEKKQPVVYIGTAPTGSPHVGYFIWGVKVADLLKAGFKVKILLADIHAALDNTPWEVLEHRYNYYEKIIPLMIKAAGADISNLEFVKGSSFQLTKEYIFDVLKMSSFVSVHDATKAASEVVKLGDNPRLSGLIYPLMQALDEEYLGVDVQLGGTDQRKILVLARENNPKMGYKSRIDIMFPLLPGLIGKKMSSSDSKTKIDLIDDANTIKEKIKAAICEEGNPDNGLLPFVKYVLMVIKQDKGEKFMIKRPAKFGGDLEYDDYEKLEKDFIAKKVHPLDLKNSVADGIINLLSLIDSKRKEILPLWKKAYGGK